MTAADSPPLLIASAPNGARKTRRDHRALPITAAQLADTAVEVMQAGARMLHLHVRDGRGRHTLDAGAYQAAIEAIRARTGIGAGTGGDLFIQPTSESAGVYTAEQQRQAIRAICAVGGVDGISIAPRELIRRQADLAPAAELFRHLRRRRILIQYILYSIRDLTRYHDLLEQGVIPAGGHSILLVAGKHDGAPATPDALRSMVDALRNPVHWMVCAFGEREFDCLTEAAKLGGHVRIGFENSIRLKSGEMAKDNRQLLTQLIESGNPRRRPPADGQQARKILAGVV